MSTQAASHTLHKEIEAARVLLADLGDILGDDVEARADAVEGQTELLEAIERSLMRVAEIEALEAGLETLMGNLKTRQSRLGKQKENLRTALAVAMEISERKRLETAVGTITLKPVPPKVQETDEALIPSQFWKPSDPKLDRKMLCDALKEQLLITIELAEAQKRKAPADLIAALQAKLKPIPGATLSNGGVTIMITSK